MSTNQYQQARQKASKEEPKKALEELFDKPPKSKEIPMANQLDELQKQIDALQKERDTLLSKARTTAIEDINTKIKTFGIRSRDLTFGEPPKPISNRPKVAMKYQSGTNSWSGRGSKPQWVQNHLEKGGTLEEILIK